MDIIREQIDPEVAQEIIAVLNKKVANLRAENAQLQNRLSRSSVNTEDDLHEARNENARHLLEEIEGLKSELQRRPDLEEVAVLEKKLKRSEQRRQESERELRSQVEHLQAELEETKSAVQRERAAKEALEKVRLTSSGCGNDLSQYITKFNKQETDELRNGLNQRTQESAVTTYIGVIQVLDSNDKFLGYIPKNLQGKAYSTYDPLVDNALVVTFTTGRTRTGSSTKLALTATNQNPAYRFLGLIQSYYNTDSDLKPNSYHFLYFGGISAPGTRPDAPPSEIGNSYNDAMGNNRTAESTVWTYDATSRVLTPQWINTDGSSPHEELFTHNGIPYIGGNKDAFVVKFGPVTTIKLKFLPS